MLALTISSSTMQSPPIPNVITEATESGSSNISSLLIDNLTNMFQFLSITVVAENNSKYCSLLFLQIAFDSIET